MKPILKTLAALSLSALLPALAVAQDYDDDMDMDEVPAPAAESPPAPGPSVPAGEWVNTEQYGWVWMPYGDAYTHVPDDGYGAPYTYVYYPSYGWTWLAAPWVWGLGPWPVFGIFGPAHFGWYGHGWWRTPHRWHWTGGDFHHGFGPGRGWRTSGGRTFPGAGSGHTGPGFRGGGSMHGGMRTGGGFGGRSAFPSGGRTFAGGGRTFAGGAGGHVALSGRGGGYTRGPAHSGGGSRSMPGGGGHGHWGR
jgi:hypothetical protein